MSPFLLLDYAGPAEFPPSEKPRGVEEHPHRGFETVTIVYSGEVEHRDSSGGGGIIGPGDVQWMTASSGLVHEEMHSRNFTRRGGILEMVQLWVNLPAKDKKSPPHYQSITDAQIPRVTLQNDAGSVRVIAGEFLQAKGPAKTFTPMNVLDIRLNASSVINLDFPEGHNALVMVLKGKASINGDQTLAKADMAILDRSGARFTVEAAEDTTLLVLGGQPINEPIVGYGPFVMNTEAEIRQAMQDYQSGHMGQLSAAGSVMT